MVGILVVTDVRFYREGLQQALDAEPDFEVVGTAATTATALDVVRAGNTHIALLDLGVGDGLPLIRAIHQIAPAVRVVALGLAETGGAVLPWAEAGVLGYVSRDSSLARLIAVVRSITEGESPCAPQVSAAMFQRLAALARHPASNGAAARLTAREVEIVTLLARGMSNREIARTLTIALPTVKNHVHNVLDKLQVRRRADAPREVFGHTVAPIKADQLI